MIKHGCATPGSPHFPEYCAWRNAVQRCTQRRHQSFANYGGRGITVCDRWNPAMGGSFLNFLADMGYRPCLHSLERKDNDGPYSPENCKWATKSEQQTNQRKTRAIQNFTTEELQAELKRRGL
jgi:hypothetical protein